MLINAGATVTVCNSKTKNLSEITRQADILIAAVGRPDSSQPTWSKTEPSLLMWALTGTKRQALRDVDFDTVKEKASYITPVPGGVGPMTIAELIENTVLSAELKA